uniref:Galactosylgalactosylxylosylprotein 3-beta-glucuronosyltransferase n=1 Tax=Ciona savignyi TaxID=51511 RepID=Q5CAR9_CIOSA|nr:beta3-glucuronyltransferase [Ciona savignyi]
MRYAPQKLNFLKKIPFWFFTSQGNSPRSLGRSSDGRRLFCCCGVTINDYLKNLFFRNLLHSLFIFHFYLILVLSVRQSLPTYSRLTQKADLTRLIQTLMHVPRFHWILIEDSLQKTALVTKLLQKSGLTFTHLNKKNTALKYTKDLQTRNTALNWIRDNVNNETDGVLYFMDDDNTYGLKLFQEMRKTKLASAWPVGLVGGLKYEGPVLCKNGRVVTWRVVWAPKRTIPIDMAGFAVSTALVRQFPKVVFVDKRELESLFLEGLGITRDTIEAQGNNCTEVNVWHTQTVKTKADLEKIATEKGTELNPLIEV